MKTIWFALLVASTVSSSAFAEKVFSLNCQVSLTAADASQFFQSQIEPMGLLKIAFGQQVADLQTGIQTANITLRSNRNFSGPSIALRNPKIVWIKSQKYVDTMIDTKDASEICVVVEGDFVSPTEYTPTNPIPMR